MNLVLLLGAGTGIGLMVLISGLIPARPALSDALANLHRPRAGQIELHVERVELEHVVMKRADAGPFGPSPTPRLARSRDFH